MDRIEYENCYIAFLDVLGFKNIVMKDNREKLNQYFRILNEVIEYIRGIESKKNIGFIVISDSIILSIPQGNTKEQKIETFRNLCIAVGLIQMKLATVDIWMRGGISCGDAYYNKDQNQIVGPAYINAYLLEENMAIYPRVIVDSKIIRELEYKSATEMIDCINMNEEGGLSFDNWGASILFNWYQPDGKQVTAIKQDIPLFIDYLFPLIEKQDSQLLEVIKNIEQNIYANTSIYSKYRWVADYLKALDISGQKRDIILGSEETYRLYNI